jgi:hypothetical protein
MTGQNVVVAVLAIEERHHQYVREEDARARASFAYHDHPSHPSSCEVYAEHAAAMGRTSTRCPCEDGWRDHLA